MKKALIFLVSILISTIAVADINPKNLHGNLNLTNNYIFRGTSHTANNPAIQGGMYYDHDRLTRFGVWASNINFNEPGAGSLEIDVYASYTPRWYKWEFEFGAGYNFFPDSQFRLNYNYGEAFALASYDFGLFSLTGEAAVSPDYFRGSGMSLYGSIGAQTTLPEGFGLEGNIGRLIIDDKHSLGLPDYTNWLVALSYKNSGFLFKLAYTDTNIDKHKCLDSCSAKILFSLGFSI